MYAITWHRLPVFSIAVGYQPGAAHQKGARKTITAPYNAVKVKDLQLTYTDTFRAVATFGS